jgi:transcription elongation factor GreA
MTSIKNIKMLKSTYEKLQLEKKTLEDRLPDVINEVNLAREKGDLRENAEYHAAKATKSDMENHIIHITSKLLKATIMSDINLKDFITFGNTVLLEDLKTNKEYIYTILGEEETDISMGIISCESILGENLLGKKKNDEFIFETPSGEREFLVKDFYIK